jgi:hypothetical protein
MQKIKDKRIKIKVSQLIAILSVSIKKSVFYS